MPSTVVRGVCGQALSLARLPAHWAGCWGPPPMCCGPNEVVEAGSPYRYPLWLARALNSAISDVKWDYEGYRKIARIAVFYVKIAVFYNKFMLLFPIL